MEKKEEYKNILKILLILLVGYWAVNNVNFIGSIVLKIFEILFPFILGACMAFILNIPMNFFEKKLSNFKIKKKRVLKNRKLLRVISLFLAIIVIIFILVLIINLIVPELINIGKILIDNIPTYINQIEALVPEDKENISNFIEELNLDTQTIKEQLMLTISGLLSSSINVISSIISGVTTFIIAIIFSIYILTSKEKLQNQLERILKAYLKNETVEKIFYVGRITRNTFSKFFTVQCFEATILGVLSIIGMLILRIPYAVPIGILIGVTALIPIVGAFVGIIVGAILICSSNYMKVIPFIIYILILQQVEGNVIYPKVVGSSVGLPSLWVLVAVSVGGSLFGIIGMLVGVPVASVIYTIIKNDVNKRTKLKSNN